MERGELERLIEQGATLRTLADALGTTPSAVRDLLQREGLATRRMRVMRENTLARTDGASEVVRICARHGATRFVVDRRGTYRCLQCRSEAVSARRRRTKAILVREAGGRCALCGYDRCARALSFHHVDPETKAFGVAYRGATRALDHAREEIRKCVLLCANCHMEVEAGLRQVA